jgi:PAS domain S-box-containing protein
VASSSDHRPPTAHARDLRDVELDVARIVAETDAPVEVYASTLEAIGRRLDWPLGTVWEVDGETGTLRCAATWAAGRRPHDFIALSETLVLAPGEGLPGRVFASGEPAWLVDATRDANFPRADAARRSGLHAGVAFPLRSSGGAVGVMEFFSSEVREPDRELLATMAALGSLVGQFVSRRRAEAALHARESRLRAMLEAALDAVVTIDARGRVLGWNHAAERMFGYPADAAIGREIADLIVPPALRALHRRGFARYLETQRPVMLDRRVEVNGMRSDGTEFPVELAITRIPLAGPPTFTGYLRDISDRVEAERELQASRKRLVTVADAERRAIQHALRDGAQQRLTSVLLSLGRLRAAADADSPLLDAAIEELRVVMRSIRELAGDLHPSVLAERGLAAALEALALRAPVQVELQALPGRRLPEHLEAAAYHVVSEALLNVMNHAGAEQVTIRASIDDRDLVVKIVDDGVGGADPDGSGLRGLADRVQALDGRISIESPVGGGTRVWAAIPHGV